MKNFKSLIQLSILLAVFFIACKKDDEPNPPVLLGTYEFSFNDNFDVKKWGEGGASLALTDSELNIYARPDWNMFPQKYKYVFTSDYKMIFADSNGVYLDTIRYRLMNNVVSLDVREFEIGMDYLPMFKVLGTTLYNDFKGVSYKTRWEENGNAYVDFEDTNLLDSTLADMGYSSLSQLKANEEITLYQFRINYVKK